MKNDMANILRSIDIDVVDSKIDKVTKLFGNGKPIGLLLGRKARFVPSNKNEQSDNFRRNK